MKFFSSLTVLLLTSVSCVAELHIDLGVLSASAPATGWTPWELEYTDQTPLNVQKDFDTSLGVNGVVQVGLSSDAASAFPRDDGYVGDRAFSQGVSAALWQDGLLLSQLDTIDTAITVNIAGLRKGEYIFVSYAGYRNLGNINSTTRVYVNEMYTGLNAICYSRNAQSTPAEFLETHVPRRIGFSVINDNDPIKIEFRYPTYSTFCLNGFEIHRNFGVSNPSPNTGLSNIPVKDIVLKWQREREVNNPAQYSRNITKHYLYLVEDHPVFAGAKPILVDDLTTDPLEMGPLSLKKDTTYYWRVDSSIRNSGPSDPETLQGPVWSFTTERDSPVITRDISNAIVRSGSTNSFRTEFTSAFPPIVQWYGHKAGSDDVLLSTRGRYQINTKRIDDHTFRSFLKISKATIADEGISFYCLISNKAGKVSSAPASLVVKRIVSYYPFDGTFQDVAGAMNGSPVGNPEFVDGASGLGQALFLDGSSYVNIGFGQPKGQVLHNGSVSFWFNVPQVERNQVFLGSLDDGITRGFWACLLRDRPAFEFRSKSGKNIHWISDTRKSISPDRWHLYTATWNSDLRGAMQMKQYIDAELVSEGTHTHIMPFSWQHPMFLGASNSRGSAEDLLFGSMDEVKFYNYPLSVKDVTQSFTDTKAAK